MTCFPPNLNSLHIKATSPNLRNSCMGPILCPKIRPIIGCCGLQISWNWTLVHCGKTWPWHISICRLIIQGVNEEFTSSTSLFYSLIPSSSYVRSAWNTWTQLNLMLLWFVMCIRMSTSLVRMPKWIFKGDKRWQGPWIPHS